MFMTSFEGPLASNVLHDSLCNASVDIVFFFFFREVPVAVHVGSAGVAHLGDGELQPGAHALPKLRQVSSVPHRQSGMFQNTLAFDFSSENSFSTQ